MQMKCDPASRTGKAFYSIMIKIHLAKEDGKSYVNVRCLDHLLPEEVIEHFSQHGYIFTENGKYSLNGREGTEWLITWGPPRIQLRFIWYDL